MPTTKPRYIDVLKVLDKSDNAAKLLLVKAMHIHGDDPVKRAAIIALRKRFDRAYESLLVMFIDDHLQIVPPLEVVDADD